MTEGDKRHVKGIIFDYGGTLDTGGDHWGEVIWDAWQKAGILVDKPLMREAYVYGERELARVRHILPEHAFSDVLRIKINIELQYLSNQGAFPPGEIEEKSRLAAEYCYETARRNTADARKVLERLAARYPLVLVSNFYGNIRTVLDEMGLSGCFKSVIESATCGVRKPDPAIFTKGVEALGLKPDEVLVVGDSYRKDILPAQAAGCRAVWLKGRQWDASDEAAEWDPTIKSLSELESTVGLLD